MIKVIAKTDTGVVVMDDSSMTIDAVSLSRAKLALHFGFSIAGLSLSESDELCISEDYFMPLETSDEDEYDDYEEDEVDDTEDFDDYDTYDDEEDDITEDEESEEDIDELDDYEDFDDYDDYYEDEEESKVSQLYAYLTDEQKAILKRYYLWYSQRIFNENKVGNNALTLKSSKKVQAKLAQMSKIRANGGLWHYAGFVDMGYHGAGHCSFGHALRYAHLAWDVTVSDIEDTFFGEDCSDDIEDIITSDACIVFGVVCISDFFEASPETVGYIQKAQRESLKDMERMLEFYQDGTIEEAKSSLKFMDYVVDKVRKSEARNMLLDKEYKPLMNKLLLQFYAQFREADMLPPKALVQEIRNNLVGWERTKIVGRLHPVNYTALHNTAEIVFGKSYKLANNELSGNGLRDILTYYIAVALQYEMCGIYKYNADTQKDEGGASRQAKTELSGLYSRIPRDFEISVDYFNKLVSVLFKCEGMKNFISEYNWYNFRDGVVSDADNPFVGYSYYMSRTIEDDYRKKYPSYIKDETLIARIRDVFREIKYYNTHIIRSLEDGSNKVNQDYETLSNLLDKFKAFKDYMIKLDTDKYEEEKRKKEDEERKRKELEEQRRAEAAKAESDSDYNARVSKEALDYLVDHKDDVDAITEDYCAFGKSLVMRYKTGKVSDNQMLYMLPIYNKLTGKNYLLRGISGVTYIDDELRAILNWCKDNKALVGDDHKYSILCSVLFNQVYSYKQQSYVASAKELYKNHNS